MSKVLSVLCELRGMTKNGCLLKSTDYGLGVRSLWTFQAFFHRNPKLLGLDRQFGRIQFGAFGIFSANLSAPIFELWVPCPCFTFHRKAFISKSKVIHPKYSKHWLSTVAHTIDCVCSKILNRGLNHGLLFLLLNLELQDCFK